MRRIRILLLCALILPSVGCDELSKLLSGGLSVDRIVPIGIIPASDFEKTGKAKLYVSFLGADGEGLVRLMGRDEFSNLINLEVYARESRDDDAERTQADVGQDPDLRKPADKKWAFIINLDSSGSMSGADPDFVRNDSAEGLINFIFNKQQDSLMAVTDFGGGNNSGFSDTRLLQDFTANVDDLIDSLKKTKNDSNTPLYESLEEIAEYMGDETNNSTHQRAILLLSDGVPNDDAQRESSIELAQDNNIVIHTIGLGSGVDNEVLLEISEETGGIYSYVDDTSTLEAAFEGIGVGADGGFAAYDVTFPPGEVKSDGDGVPVDVELSTIGGFDIVSSTIDFYP